MQGPTGVAANRRCGPKRRERRTRYGADATGVRPLVLSRKILLMTSSLWGARGVLHRCAGIVLTLATVVSLVTPAPAISATAPAIVSVDISGNAHVPTSTIMNVIAAKPGQPYDPRVVQADLQRIFALGYFSDQAAPLIRQRPGGIAITYRVIENPVITKITFAGNSHVPTDTL